MKPVQLSSFALSAFLEYQLQNKRSLQISLKTPRKGGGPRKGDHVSVRISSTYKKVPSGDHCYFRWVASLLGKAIRAEFNDKQEIANAVNSCELFGVKRPIAMRNLMMRTSYNYKRRTVASQMFRFLHPVLYEGTRAGLVTRKSANIHLIKFILEHDELNIVEKAHCLIAVSLFS